MGRLRGRRQGRRAASRSLPDAKNDPRQSAALRLQPAAAACVRLAPPALRGANWQTGELGIGRSGALPQPAQRESSQKKHPGYRISHDKQQQCSQQQQPAAAEQPPPAAAAASAAAANSRGRDRAGERARARPSARDRPRLTAAAAASQQQQPAAAASSSRQQQQTAQQQQAVNTRDQRENERELGPRDRDRLGDRV